MVHPTFIPLTTYQEYSVEEMKVGQPNFTLTSNGGAPCVSSLG